jgi:hypothetical protein
MRACALVFLDDIRLGPIFWPKQLPVEIGITISNRFVWEEAQRLVCLHRPGHFLVHVGLDHLCSPITVVAADKADDRNVVQQTGQHDLFRLVAFERVSRALQQMRCRSEAMTEIVDQRWLLWHRRQARIVAHEKELFRMPGAHLHAGIHLDVTVHQVREG